MTRFAPARAIGPNSIVERIQACLIRLNAPFRVPESPGSQAKAQLPGLVDQVIREVDETVLPRRFEVLIEDRVCACLFISNRRLVHMDVSGAPVLPRAESDITAEVAARAYVAALRRLGEDMARPSLRLAERTAIGTAGHAACSAAHLSQAAETTGAETRLQTLLARLAPLAEGWSATFGAQRLAKPNQPPELAERLQRIENRAVLVAGKSTQYERLDHGAPACTALPLSADMTLILACHGTDRILIALRISELPNALRLWQSLFSAPQRP